MKLIDILSLRGVPIYRDDEAISKKRLLRFARNDIYRAILISSFYFSISGWTWGDSLASKNREGNKLYKEGKVSEALSKWRGAQIENPDSDKLHYNIGNGLHEQKKYEDAFNEYEKSLDSKDSELQSKAYYNMGNTRYRMGKLAEAIEDYEKCLAINPQDEDAKYNIEFIKKKLEEKKQQESRQKENKDQGQQKQGQSPQAQQGKEQQPGQEEKKEENKEVTGKEEKSSGEEKKGEMSKEDAVRLLDALKDDEKELQKELRRQPIGDQYKVDKDW